MKNQKSDRFHSRRIQNDCRFISGPLPPKHKDPVIVLPNFETFREAKKRRRKKIKLLRNGRDCDRKIAKAIKNCLKGRRCFTQPCDVCVQRFRRRLTGVGYDLLESSPFPAFLATLVHKKWQSHPGDLRTFDLRKNTKTFQKQLGRPEYRDLSFVLGGWDFSFNVDELDEFPPHWQPHVHAVFVGPFSEESLKAELAKLYPKSPPIFIPVDVQLIDEPIGALTYIYKTIFRRRISKRDSRGKRYPVYRKLDGDELRELLRFLDGYTFSDRLIKKNLRLRGESLAMISSPSPIPEC